MLSELNIKKAVIIDDQVNSPLSEAQIDTILRTFVQKHAEFSDNRVDDHDIREFINDYADSNDFQMVYDNEGLLAKIIDVVKDSVPGIDLPHTSYIVDHIKKIYPNLTVHESEDICDCSDYDLILIDYDFRGQFTGIDKLGALNLSRDRTYYIVFLSSHNSFSFEGELFEMGNQAQKQDLLRKCSHKNDLQLMGLLNYVSKQKVVSETGFQREFEQIFKEYIAAKIMLDTMKHLLDLLNQSTTDAVKKLLLSNTKTMKALIVEKLEEEGISETTYLVDFAFSLAKNVINSRVDLLSGIHDRLQLVQGWQTAVLDSRTDLHLSNLRADQIFDKAVNSRFEPIQFGDVFQLVINDKPTKALLLSQTCDLVVRKISGKETPNRNDSSAILILQTPSPKKGESFYTLRIGDEEVCWDVKDTIIYPSEILDLTSLNINGESNMALQLEIEKKFSWSNYYYQYINHFKKKFEERFKDSSKTTYEYRGLLYPVSVHDNVVKFQINRIGRLDTQITNHLLNLYIRSKSRVPLMLDPSTYMPDMEKIFASTDPAVFVEYYKEGKQIYLDLETLTQLIGHKRVNEIYETLTYDEMLLSDKFNNRILIEYNAKVDGMLRKHGCVFNFSKHTITLQTKESRISAAREAN